MTEHRRADSGAEDRAVVLLATAGSSEEGERLARALVEERLAACVNVVGGVRSIYRWRGEIEVDAEVLLVIKSAASRVEELRRRLRALHSYELPELIQLEVGGGDSEYLAWVLEESAG